MSPALSRKTLRELRRYVAESRGDALTLLAALDAALRSSKASRFRTTRRKAVKAEKKTKALETSEIRRAVFLRADGRCEICLASRPAELHHAFGRIRVRQSISNCLAVCNWCHRAVTENDPSAAECWGWIAAAFGRLGLAAEAELATSRLAFVSQRSAFTDAARRT